MSEKYYSVKNNLVQDHVDHWGYHLNNPKDAEKLCEKLNNYETLLRHLSPYEKNLEEVKKQLKQVIMSLSILQADIEKLKEKTEQRDVNQE